MAHIIVRPATNADLDTLLRFEQGVISAERPFDPTLKPDPISYYDLSYMLTAPEVELVVAEQDGVLIGSGYARIETAKHYLKHSRHAYLGFMYVVPEFRGKGVNRLIISALQQWALTRDITELRLDVYHDNHPAIAAYEKVGFKKHMILMRLGPIPAAPPALENSQWRSAPTPDHPL
jgi:RimJ/RimL family protein N-acetyltransferase